MKGAARRGFLLAKMYGTVARSYLGANFRDLLRLKSLVELQALLWPAPSGEPPAGNAAGVGVASLPAQEMEAQVAREGIAAMRAVLDYIGEPVPILVHILRRVEYQNLKIVLRGIEAGHVDTARLQDLGDYAGLPLDDARDFEKLVRASPYAWSLQAMKASSRAQVENRVDCAWFVELLRLARALPSRGRAGVLRYVMLEISIANAIGALRLRFSFGMEAAAAQPLLVPGLGDPIRKAVARAFEIPPDSLEEWRRWRFGWLLGDQLVEAFRAPDPARAAAKASQRLYTRAHQLLHQHPSTLCPPVAYFFLKQHETALLKSAVEALALGVPEKELLAIVGES